MVLGFHGLSSVRGGWVGVDVFFVLSGYLITTLLLREHQANGRIDLRAFYGRRAIRLLPAFTLMLLLAVPLLLGPLHHKLTVSAPVDIGSTVFYANNWVQVIHPDGLGPLVHAWSLSIEEQFYLIWPLTLLVLMYRRVPVTRIASGVLVVFVLLVLATAAWSLQSDVAHLQFASTTRGVALLGGCYLALRPFAIGFPTAAVAAVLLLIATFTLPIDTRALTLGGYGALAVVITLLIAHIVNGNGPLAALFRMSWLRGVGLVSYGLYLFHYPIFMLSQDSHRAHAQQWAFEIVGTVSLTLASYYFVEKPALRWKSRLQPRREPVSEETIPELA